MHKESTKRASWLDLECLKDGVGGYIGTLNNGVAAGGGLFRAAAGATLTIMTRERGGVVISWICTGEVLVFSAAVLRRLPGVQKAGAFQKKMRGSSHATEPGPAPAEGAAAGWHKRVTQVPKAASGRRH